MRLDIKKSVEGVRLDLFRLTFSDSLLHDGLMQKYEVESSSLLEVLNECVLGVDISFNSCSGICKKITVSINHMHNLKSYMLLCDLFGVCHDKVFDSSTDFLLYN